MARISASHRELGSELRVERRRSGILRIGTTSYIDSFNPWNYIEGQGLNAMIMVYPALVQVEYSKKEGYFISGDWARSWSTSKDGKTWTYKLRPNTKWSDGKPMTADDAAWTINTTVKYVGGATAVQGSTTNHVVRATAPNATTLVVKYNAPVGNALWLIGGLPIVPRHIWEPYEKKQKGGKALKTVPARGQAPDGHGRRVHDQAVREEGHDRLHPGPELLRAEVERRRGRAHLLHELRLDDRRAAAWEPRLGSTRCPSTR
jgi:peptide/nickel transport system substrate-binding protein